MQINEEAWRQLQADVGTDVMHLVVARFHDELERRAQSIVAAVEALDAQEIAREAQSIKSAARTVGLDDVASCAESIEHCARNDAFESVMENTGTLADLCKRGARILAERVYRA
jgi:HPt (histidine-containing phosphotransfer) domain-containing protein